MVCYAGGARVLGAINNSEQGGITIHCSRCGGTFGPLGEFPDNCPGKGCTGTREDDLNKVKP